MAYPNMHLGHHSILNEQKRSRERGYCFLKLKVHKTCLVCVALKVGMSRLIAKIRSKLP